MDNIIKVKKKEEYKNMKTIISNPTNNQNIQNSIREI